MFGRTRFRISRFFSIYFITEPLYEYLQTSISSRVFHYTANPRFVSGEIVAYETDIKNFFCVVTLLTSSVQPQRGRKRENSERAAHFLLGFFGIIAGLTLSNLLEIVMRSSATSISLEILIQRLIITGEKISLVKARTSLCKGSLYRGSTLRIVQQTSRIKCKASRAQPSDKRYNIDTIPSRVLRFA